MRCGHLVALAVLAVAVLAGCGGGEDRPAATQTPAAATPQATASATPTTSGAPAKVRIKNFDFAPARLAVEAGTKVTWTNQDASNHTVTFAKAPGDLGNVDEKGKATATFQTPGTYPYVCQYHPNMKGTITVK